MWEDWEFDDYESTWWEDYPTNPITVSPIDPYAGTDTDPFLYKNIFATPGSPNWPADSTPMNDDDLSTNDDTQTGGFWDDVSTLFGGLVGGLANTAAGAANQAGAAWIKKNITPATTTGTPAAAAAPDYKTLGILAAVGVLAFILLRRRD
jgi:hypothetical protein